MLKNQKAMPLEQRLSIIVQVCRGLDYAHARGILHRDIKPANVIVTTEGVAKIVDFGIARLADQKLTRAGHVLGTVSYMSPEQLQGRALDGRSDIFAVGVMLFEALTSILPFGAEDTGSTITNILYRQPPKLASFLVNYPAELDEIVSKCLAKDPAERFRTPGELADRLSQIQQEAHLSQIAPTIVRPARLTTEAANQPLPPLLSPPVTGKIAPSKAQRRLISAVAIALAVLLGSVGWLMLHVTSRSGQPASPAAPAPMATKTGAGELAQQVELDAKAAGILAKFFNYAPGSLRELKVVWLDLASSGAPTEFYATYFHKAEERSPKTGFVIVGRYCLDLFTIRGDEPENLYHERGELGDYPFATHARLSGSTFFIAESVGGSGGFLSFTIYSYDGIGKLRPVFKQDALLAGHLFVRKDHIYLRSAGDRYEVKYQNGAFTLVPYNDRPVAGALPGYRVLVLETVTKGLVARYDGRPVTFVADAQKHVCHTVEPLPLKCDEQVVIDDTQARSVRVMSDSGEIEWDNGFFHALRPKSRNPGLLVGAISIDRGGLDNVYRFDFAVQ
jgi:hypothetical protein